MVRGTFHTCTGLHVGRHASRDGRTADVGHDPCGTASEGSHWSCDQLCTPGPEPQSARQPVNIVYLLQKKRRGTGKQKI